MKKKINIKYIIIVFLIVCISIGFAYLSTTLNILGTTNISRNSWNIYFDNIQYVRGQSFETIAPTTSGTNTTSLSYTVNLLEPGDVYKFNVDIVNGGSIDAMVKVVTDTELTDAQKKYASYYVTYSDGISCDDYQLLPHGETDTLSVMVSYNRDIEEEYLPTEDKEISVTFHLEFEQATSKATERNHITVVERADDTKLSVGDEIALGTEHFYVLKTDNEKTTLITKYDVNSGPDVNTEMTEGLQMTENRTINTGMPSMAFSNTNYWAEEGTLKSKYGNNFPAEVYDETYNSETGNDYSIAYYVNKYVETLSTLNLKIVKGRLLLINEAIELGCVKNGDDYDCTNAYSLLSFSNSYWINLAYSDSRIYRMYKSNKVITKLGYNGTGTGLRPVIEIPALDI